MTRFPRSTREAFAHERFPAIFGPYRREGERVADVLLAVVLGVAGAVLLFFWWGA